MKKAMLVTLSLAFTGVAHAGGGAEAGTETKVHAPQQAMELVCLTMNKEPLYTALFSPLVAADPAAKELTKLYEETKPSAKLINDFASRSRCKVLGAQDSVVRVEVEAVDSAALLNAMRDNKEFSMAKIANLQARISDEELYEEFLRLAVPYLQEGNLPLKKTVVEFEMVLQDPDESPFDVWLPLGKGSENFWMALMGGEEGFNQF